MKPAVFLLSSALIAGCANVTAVPVTAKNPDPHGLRVKVARSILVADGGGQSVVQIGDPCNEYAVQVYALLAKNKTDMTLNPNGTLAQIKSDLDSTDAIDLAKDLLKVVTAASGGGGGAAFVESQMQFYDFVCDKDGILSLKPLLGAPVVMKRTLAPTVIVQPPAPAQTPPKKRSLSMGG